MRAKYLVCTALVSLAVLGVVLRHHIRDISELLQTYGSFHAYVGRHQDVLFRIPQTESLTADISLSEPVPKIIHQIFLADSRPSANLDKYADAIESCKALHPTWEFRMWTDRDGETFVEKHYGEIYPHYKAYKQNIQRANVLRYALLHHFGGVYLDLDVTCRVALDAPLEPKIKVPALTYLPFLTPGAYPAGVNNAFILTRPQHPFFAELLNLVPSRDLFWGMPYVENMLSTGCGFFGSRWVSYVLKTERQEAAGLSSKKEDRVYILADENGDMGPQMLRGKIVTPLFEHGGASSWHGWDAAMIVLIGKHYAWFAAGLFVVGTLLVLGLWRLARRSKRSKRNQHGRSSSWRAITGAISRLSLERRSTDKHRDEDEEERLMKDG